MAPVLVMPNPAEEVVPFGMKVAFCLRRDMFWFASAGLAVRLSLYMVYQILLKTQAVCG